MFITLTRKKVFVPGYDKINVNINSIVYVCTNKDDNYGIYTRIGYGGKDCCISVAETQDQVMTMINAALRIENERAEHQTKNRLADMLSKRSA